MGKLWTVKEVCALTGLTGKHLYYFQHNGIARAARFANYSVEGHDGYKLYDDAGVAKLQQIAMYYELGLKRNEIVALMKAPDYDMNRALDELKTMMEEKRSRLERHLAVIDQLRVTGTRNGLLNMFNQISLEELGRNTVECAKAPIRDIWSDTIGDQEILAFQVSMDPLLSELCSMESDALSAGKGMALMEEMFHQATLRLGLLGYLLLFGIFLSAVGEGNLKNELAEEFSVALTAEQGRAALQYIKQDAQLLLEEAAQVIARHHEAIGKPFDDSEVNNLVFAVKGLLAKHFGLQHDAEYRYLLDQIKIDPSADSPNYLAYLLNALKYHCR